MEEFQQEYIGLQKRWGKGDTKSITLPMLRKWKRNKERIDDNGEKYSSQNVCVNSINPDNNHWHIPFSKAYTERIANLAIEVIEEYNIQLIDSYYILPYGIAAFKPRILLLDLKSNGVNNRCL